ncbi:MULTISPECIES: hypothetical protein [unclassified Sulfurospirillum]|uniref:hypothetical protein n=1 Tax=unclassified Sulfurospirillum TaxID=2618290 RepID=UPI000A6E648B|nr:MULTISPECIES: hypothetical protein [unclassified Sulfurospirillum]
MIRFVYTKNDTLFFVLNHPCAKMEFNYKRNLIKSLLKEVHVHFPECGCLHVNEVQAFVTNQKSEEEALIVSANSEIFYAEQATGAFETLCEDEKLHSLFEAIKETIAKNRTC